MRILYIHQYFKTPCDPGSTRSYFISLALINAGHEVIMITQNKTATEKVYSRFIDGIKVIYINNWYTNEMATPSKVKSYLLFMIKSTIHALKINDVDLVISTSTPLSVGLPALLLKKLKGKPYLFEVRDLWPLGPIQGGELKNPLFKWAAKKLERVLYKNAGHIVALSPGISEGIIKHVPKDKISMIPNMAKNDYFCLRPKNKNLLKNLGLIENSFKVIYFGAMNISNGIMYILNAAKKLKETNHNDVEFLFFGEGNAKKECLAFAENYSLTNVHIYNRFPMDTISEIVNFCDVSVITFKNISVHSTNSPNKLFDSLSAAKPIIVNSNGWTRSIVENNNCGAYVDPENPNELVDLLIKWKNEPQLLKELGANGRKLAETTYDKSILTKKFVDTVEKHFSSK